MIAAPTSDEQWLAVSVLVAEALADCNRRKVGAVTLDSSGLPASIGANAGPAGQPGCTAGGCPRGRLSYDEHPGYGSGNHDYSDCISVHAEVRSGDSPGGTMYISAAPCRDCTRFIEQSSLDRAVWLGGEWNRRNQ